MTRPGPQAREWGDVHSVDSRDHPRLNATAVAEHRDRAHTGRVGSFRPAPLPDVLADSSGAAGIIRGTPGAGRSHLAESRVPGAGASRNTVSSWSRSASHRSIERSAVVSGRS